MVNFQQLTISMIRGCLQNNTDNFQHPLQLDVVYKKHTVTLSAYCTHWSDTSCNKNTHSSTFQVSRHLTNKHESLKQYWLNIVPTSERVAQW